MEITAVSDLSARQRVAIIVMSMGAAAKPLLQQLGVQETERLAEEIIQMGEVPVQVRDEVLTEFQNRLSAESSTSEGGLEKAAEVLEAGFGKNVADASVRRIEWRANDILRRFARKDPERFAAMLEVEHPQTAAFLLTQLPQDISGRAIAALPEKTQTEVTFRIATMREISPAVAAVVHGVVTRKLSSQSKAKRTEAMGGEQKAAGLLNMVPVESQQALLDTLEAQDPELAARVRKLMFVFKDILLIDDRGIQRVLKDVDTKQLVMALKTAEPVVQDKIFRNLSERAAQTIREEIEFTKVKPADIELAQETIIAQIRILEGSGEIVVERGGVS